MDALARFVVGSVVHFCSLFHLNKVAFHNEIVSSTPCVLVVELVEDSNFSRRRLGYEGALAFARTISKAQQLAHDYCQTIIHESCIPEEGTGFHQFSSLQGQEVNLILYFLDESSNLKLHDAKKSWRWKVLRAVRNRAYAVDNGSWILRSCTAFINFTIRTNRLDDIPQHVKVSRTKQID